MVGCARILERLTIYDIPTIVREAHLSALTPRNITAGFRSTGIHPFNRDLFAEDDFAPAATTDRPNPSLDHANEEEPAKDPVTTDTPARPTEQPQSADDSYVSPAALLPIPKAGPRKASNKGHKKGKSKILTSTPVRKELEEEAANKKRKASKTGNHRPVKKTLFKPPPKNTSPPAAPETSTPSESSDSDVELELNDSDHSNVDDDTEYIEGDFVVVCVKGKDRTLHYIARIDVLDDEGFEGIFLKKILTNTWSSRSLFSIKMMRLCSHETT
jgi:hypothetical protein